MDYLAAILAAPDDLALREVWADVLQRDGDPRGELIAIQLAKLAGREARDGWARERELVREHATAWSGPLGRAFQRPIFEGGMLAGGSLWHFEASIFDEPAWPLISTLCELRRDMPTTIRDAFVAANHPRSRITRILGVDAEAVLSWLGAGGRGDAIRELGLWRLEAEEMSRLAAHLPALRTLGISGSSSIATLSPIADQVERLRLDGVASWQLSSAASLVQALVERGGALRTVELAMTESFHYDWRVRLVRDTAPGPFTRIVAWLRGEQAPKDTAEDCGRFLALCDPSRVRSVEIEIGRPRRFQRAAIAELTARLAAMSALEQVVVPWSKSVVSR